MTNQEVLNMQQPLSAVSGLPGAKFAYAIARNIKCVLDESKNIDEALHAIKGYNEFEEKRINLAKKYSKKDAKGEAMLVDNQFILEDQKAFSEALDILKIEYKKTLDEKDIFLDLKSDIELYQLNKSNLPENITGAQLSGIIEIIK